MSVSRVIATLSLAAIVGAGGYWAGKNDVGALLRRFVDPNSAVIKAEPRREGTGAVIYYRHPDGLAEYSAKPKSTDDGRPFAPIRASEDISLGAAGAVAPGMASVSLERKILYYRNPMGLPDTSKVPKKDSMGMDYLPVYDGEISDSSTVKVTLGKLQRTGVKTALAEMTTVSRKIRVPGTVTLDERMISIVSMRADAFVEDVADVTTGDRIIKGENLLLLYLNFKALTETFIVMLSLPFALVGGIWMMWWLGFNASVAVAVGFIALAGVAAETGVIMLIYLDHALRDEKAKCEAEGRAFGKEDRNRAIMVGAVERVRPKMMTVVAIMAGLVPILWSTGAGSEIMQRIAVPMIGGMISSTILTLVVIPAVYGLTKGCGLKAPRAENPVPATLAANQI